MSKIATKLKNFQKFKSKITKSRALLKQTNLPERSTVINAWNSRCCLSEICPHIFSYFARALAQKNLRFQIAAKLVDLLCNLAPNYSNEVMMILSSRFSSRRGFGENSSLQKNLGT